MIFMLETGIPTNIYTYIFFFSLISPFFHYRSPIVFNMSTYTPPRILVIGHSFVWRLNKFITESTRPCIDRHFCLTDAASISFHGIGGRTVDRLRDSDLHAVFSFKPTLLILEIGSNDLCDPNLAVPDLAANILRLIKTFHITYQVPYIIVSQVLRRRRPPIMTPSYNNRVPHLNNVLHNLLKQVPFATLWFHLDLIRATTNVFLPDGVHLNDNGNHLLYHSYLKAILRTLHHADRCARRPNPRLSVSRRPSWHSRRRPARSTRSRQLPLSN